MEAGSPRRKDTLARLQRAAGVLIVAAAACLAYALGALSPLDDALSQQRFRLLSRQPSATLTVVEIDVDSLRAAETWPWSRERFAKAIDNLNRAGAQTVGLDVDFSARSSVAADDALATVIRRWPGQVILPTFVQQAGHGADRRQVATRPLAALAEEAILASVNVPVDADGRVRRYPNGFETVDGLRPSMAATLLGRSPRAASFLIDYGLDAKAINRISFQDVYAGRFDSALVRGKNVLIGSTAIELGDQFATPKRGVLQGVYIHALAYESLLAGRDLRPLGWPFLVMAVILTATFLRPRAKADYGSALRRHVLVLTLALGLPVALQAWAPISVDAAPVLVAQGLSLVWLVRTELKRRADSVIEARETHLRQLADHMRESRDRIRVAHDELAVANAALDRALRARTDFLAMTSHEIRTPLNGVMGMTQVILADPNLPAGVREKVRLAHASGETMLALVNDLLDVAKMESGTISIAKARMDLHSLFDETLALWSDKARAKGLSLYGDRAGTPSLIEEDAGRLRQILFNLLGNAIKFTDKGQVSLTAGVDASDAGDQLVIQVSDSGIGIAPEDIERIFEPFTQADASTTRKHEGTGLGLAICRRLAVAMGGTLVAESEIGSGSVFTVRLPLRAICTKGRQAGAPETLSTASALLVEGNPLARGVMKATLSDRVASLEIAASLAEALSAMALRNYDVLLVEGKVLGGLPDELINNLRHLKKSGAAQRVALMWGGDPGEVAALSEVADLVVQKPISPAELVERLDGLFMTSPAPSAEVYKDILSQPTEEGRAA